jgi:hypothetical protein
MLVTLHLFKTFSLHFTTKKNKTKTVGPGLGRTVCSGCLVNEPMPLLTVDMLYRPTNLPHDLLCFCYRFHCLVLDIVLANCQLFFPYCNVIFFFLIFINTSLFNKFLSCSLTSNFKFSHVLFDYNQKNGSISRSRPISFIIIYSNYRKKKLLKD